MWFLFFSSQLNVLDNSKIDRHHLKQVMATTDIHIRICIGDGDCSATAWGCDLTHGYIDINTAYN